MPKEVDQPTAKINFHVEDKIAFGKDYAYSHVKYGLSVTRDVPDEGVEDLFQNKIPELVEQVENFVAEERSRILEVVQGQSSGVS